MQEKSSIMIRIKTSKVLLSAIALGLLSACASTIPTAEKKRSVNNGTTESTRTNYNEVTIEGECVADHLIGGDEYGIQYAVCKYRNLIWKCNHGTKICTWN